MHDRQRRDLLRALFWLVCLLPTAAVGAWSYSLRTAGHREAAAERIGAALGMRVTLDAVRYPLPGLTLLEGFRAYDPETDALVLEAARLEAEPSTEGLALAASQMEVFADKGARLFAALERRLKRELPDAELQVRCEFDQLTWHTAAGPQTVTHFDALVGPTESGRQLLVNFRPADVGGGARVDEPASLRLARTNAASGAETTVELATGTTPLPCSMFAPLVPAAADLGAEALVDGRLKLKHLPQGWEGVLSGTLRQVDFQRLVGEHSSQQLWAQGDLRVTWAELQAGRIDRMRGTVEAGPGQISGDLVAAGIEHLGLGDPRVVPTTHAPLLFDRLELDFTLDADGLRILPRNAARPDALLWHRETAYWVAPANVPQSPANLLRALAPERELLVPLAAPTRGLLDILPLPQSGPRRDAPPALQGQLPQPRLRLKGPTGEEPQVR